MATHMPGGFVLGELIGRGGTAEVWRAAHMGRPIAVKVLTTERARHPRYHQLFRNEVRATAGLSHPGVLTVLEHGEMLPPDPRAGCPWLAMELADGGSLHPRCGRQDWATCKTQLLSLLSALAHAHARGIIHRDIKPTNALFVGGVLKLSDFGLAWSGSEEVNTIVGTPAYMAPEQFEGHWREFGPWTDLYALGCLAWQLVCGAPPFVADRAGLLAAAHLSWPLPTLRPAIAVPDGLADWLAGLLEKSPADRFQRAADAAWALRHLGEPVSAVFPPQHAFDAETTLTTEITLPTPIITPPRSAAPVDFPLPPMATTWRDPESMRPPALPGAGMSLYGLRTIPLCGRTAERDQLWAALRAVHDTRQPGLVILEGSAGTGKSRLAEWLCVTAHASGVADYVHAVHSPAGGRAEGLLAMLLRATGCASLSPLDARDRLIEKLRGALRPDDLAALLDLLTNTNTPTTAAERLALLTRWVAHAARRRPLILWLDDVAWGADALTLADRLLEQTGLPVLLLLTAATPELAERPIERAHLATLAARPGALRLSVGPLPPKAHARLIQQILGLDPALARTLQAHTAGNPLFAVQLVGDWVAGGALVEGPAGLRLVDGGPLLLPLNLQEVWSHRLARLLHDRPEDDTRALELAAVLGDRVDAGEWRRVCLRAGCRHSPDLIEALIEERLITSPDPEQGFAFVHRLLRQSLLEDLHMSGRWKAHHRDCAEALSDPERRGRHRLEAGQPAEAIPDLLTTARRALELAEVRRAQAALADWHRALSALSAGPDDPRQGHGLAMEIEALRRLGRFDEAESLSDACVARATPDWPGRPELLHAAARVSHIRGNIPTALDRLQSALEQLASRPPDLTAARCHQLLGRVLIDMGQTASAEAHYEASCALFEQLGDQAGLFSMVMTRTSIALNAGRLEEARDFGEQALSLARQRRQRTWLGDAWLYLGEVARRGEDYAEAEVFYQRALAISQATGWVGGMQIIRLNIALVDLELGRIDEATRISAEIAGEMAASGRRLLENLLVAVELGCAVGRGQQAESEALLSQLEGMIAVSGMRDWDLGRLAALCAGQTAGWAIQERLEVMAIQQGYRRPGL